VECIIFLYALGIWIMLLILSIVNAVIRETLYAPKIGEHLGHAVSSLIAIAYTLAVTYWLVDNIKMDVTRIDLLWIGVFWLILTTVFEFGFG